MSQMVYVVRRVRLVSRTYSIPTFTVPIGFWSECSGWLKKLMTITWDEVKTRVTGARLIITRIHSDRDPVDVRVRWNGADVKRFFWAEGTKCTPQSDVVDVTLLNGLNYLEVRACKHYYWPGRVNVTFSGYVEVFYEGEAPERPSWEAAWEWLEANWPWLVLGAGAVIIGGAAYYALRGG